MTDYANMSDSELLALYNQALPTPKLSPRAETQLNDAREAARNAIQVQRDLRQFGDLNTQQKSGGFLALPKIGDVAGAFDPEIAQMNAITARMAPAQRVPGSGTTSDRDLALFLQASPSVKSPKGANDALIERGRAESIRRQAYSDFLDNYAKQNKGSLIGADIAFRKQPLLGVDVPYDLSKGQSRQEIPLGALYRDPQGNIRRNDNYDRGNPILTPNKKERANQALRTKSRGGWTVEKVED